MIHIATILLLLGSIGGLLALPTASQAPLYTPQERFGIGFVSRVPVPGGTTPQSIGEYRLAPLKVGWYSDWAFSAAPAMPADGLLEYVQLLEVAGTPPDWSAVRHAAQQRPGSLWIIGNEPECPNQGDLMPQAYAQRYQEAYQQIKSWDATAHIAFGGVVEPTPLRKLWIERVLEAYRNNNGGKAMPVDVWTIHIQILREGSVNAAGSAFEDRNAGAGIPTGIDDQTALALRRDYDWADNANPGILQTMVSEFRQWMKEWGYQDRELIISEMGVLYPSTILAMDRPGSEAEQQLWGDLMVERFMIDSFEWLLAAADPQTGHPEDGYRLVQRWLWYSLNDHFFWEGLWARGYNGSLYDYQTKQPTRFGQRFIAYRNREARTERLFLPWVSR